MEEDMEMEIADAVVFEVREIDLEYEFDAARWFDFTREESPAEACESERWFDTAATYPPSPFVTKMLLREEVFDDTIEPCPKWEDDNEAACPQDDYMDNGQQLESCAMDMNTRDCGMHTGIFSNLQSGNFQKVLNQPFGSTKGLKFISQTTADKLKGKPKSSVKPVLPRSSTLMKPTASQLAKQNHSRFRMLLDQNNEKSSSLIESQAAKRQKLEGGLLHKVAGTKSQISFVHKASKKEGTLDKNSQQGRVRITIPQEPELSTAQRAQRAQRARSIWPKNDTKVECESAALHRFKARPLNRKILEAPLLPLRKKSTPRLPEFHEFHLKTSERAKHSSAVSTSSYHSDDLDKGSEKPSTNFVADCSNRETRRPSVMDASKQENYGGKYVFKARPLNKKILTSKGDIGIFRNSKRETTVPREFNFQREQRVQPNLPIDLFGKLSITSELQPNNGSQSKLPQPTPVSMKGSKENRLHSFQAGNEITGLVKGKQPPLVANQIHSGNNGFVSEANQQWTTRRSLGIH